MHANPAWLIFTLIISIVVLPLVPSITVAQEISTFRQPAATQPPISTPPVPPTTQIPATGITMPTTAQIVPSITRTSPANSLTLPADDFSTWRAEYFNNLTLSGSPALVRDEPTIDHTWEGNSPAPGTVDVDFSARWTRNIWINKSGNYKVVLNHDDGGRVWIDGSLVLNAWYGGYWETHTVDRYLTAGEHSFRIEIYDQEGWAAARFSLQALDFAGWRGEYYSNDSLSGWLAFVRDDDEVDFDWGYGSPAPNVISGPYSARWTKSIPVDVPGLYQIVVHHDDGVRVWIDDRLLMDQWTTCCGPDTIEVNLSRATHRFRIEYNNLRGASRIRFTFSRSSSSRTYLPYIGRALNTSLPVGWSENVGVTDQVGVTVFDDPNATVRVRVNLQDTFGRPISNVAVYTMANGEERRLYVLDPQYAPMYRVVNYDDYFASGVSLTEPDVLIVPIVITLVKLAVVGWSIYEFVNDHPRVDLEVGYTRVCTTVGGLMNSIGLGASGKGLLAVHTFARKRSWVWVGRELEHAITGELKDELGQMLGQDFFRWLTGQGEWCFRVTTLQNGAFLAITPESDMVRHGTWRAVLRWDTASTDVDLHVYDTYGNHAWYRNKVIPGGELDFDDQDGFGPETYRQYEPRAPFYDVWAQYYSDHGWGPTRITVEIYDYNERLKARYIRQMFNNEWFPVARVIPEATDLRIIPIPNTADQVISLELTPK